MTTSQALTTLCDRRVDMRENRYRSTLILACILILLASINPKVYGARRPNISRMNVKADLDGDGREERIRFASFGMRENQSYNTFVLNIRGVRAVFDGDNLLGSFNIVDIDTADSVKEIAVVEEGPSDDYRTYYLRYSQDKIYMIGSIPSSLRAPETIVDGSGIIYARTRSNTIDTWWYLGVYQYNGETERIEEIVQEEYVYGRRVSLLMDLPLYKDRDMDTVAYIIHKGDQGTITRTDNERWCYFEGDDGEKGYFPVKGTNVLQLNKRSSEVFDGLHFVD